MSNKPFKQASKTGWVLVSDLTVYPDVQRQLTPNWVMARVSDFDVDKLGHIVINIRADGTKSVVDGQHRVELMRAIGWGDQKIEAEIFTGLSTEEEAELFLARNDRKAVRKFDKFRVSVSAGNAEAVDISRIVHTAGLAISDQKRDGHIAAVDKLERIYRGASITGARDGAAALNRTLHCIKHSWGSNSAGFQGDVLLGLGMVQLRYNGHIDQKAMAQKLAPIKGGPSGLLGNARAMHEMRGRPVAHCVAAVIVDIYNRGRRVGKLDDWEARGSVGD